MNLSQNNLTNSERNYMSRTLRLINTAIMSLVLTFFMTLYITWVNLGIRPDFIQSWMKAWLMAIPAAFVCVLLLATPVQKISQAIHKKLFEK